jgi:uncharacterized membrane protein YgcG
MSVPRVGAALRLVARTVLLAGMVGAVLVAASGATGAQTTPSSSVCDIIRDPALRQECVSALTNVTSVTPNPSPVTVPPDNVPNGVEQIRSYGVNLAVQPDGTLQVRETIGYDFGVVPHHGIFRDIPVRFDYPKLNATDRVYPLSVTSVSASAGTPAQYTTDTFSTGGVGYERIKIGDPNTTITGVHTYKIAYRVQAVLNRFSDHDELVWNAIGGQWTVPIQAVTVAVETPAAITRINCAQGPTGSNESCATAQFSGNAANFGQSLLSPQAGLTVTVAIPKVIAPSPKPVLEQRFTIGRAFAVTPVTGGVAGALTLLFVGGLLLYLWRVGRDRRYRGSAVDQSFGNGDGPDERAPIFEHTETPVEFEPPDGLRPGEVGTLVGLRAHPLDVTATIIDLAVRKYLKIEEVDPASHWLKVDWKLTKLKDPDDQLKPYEQQLLKGLLKGGDHVLLSKLRNHFATCMNKVEKELVDDAMKQGWFTRRPDSVRSKVFGVGIVTFVAGVALTIALTIWTHAALLGIPVIVFGALVTVGSRFAPARAAKGSALLRRVNGFRRFINESEKERARFAENKNLFSEYLPYAIVFGATEKWAKAFEGLAGEPPDTGYWYGSMRPFDYAVFSSSIHGFTVTAGGTLTSTPPSTSGSSGFSGGGFSGGGAGGGGGGSW